jgi:hypothetical protein
MKALPFGIYITAPADAENILTVEPLTGLGTMLRFLHQALPLTAGLSPMLWQLVKEHYCNHHKVFTVPPMEPHFLHPSYQD